MYRFNLINTMNALCTEANAPNTIDSPIQSSSPSRVASIFSFSCRRRRRFSCVFNHKLYPGAQIIQFQTRNFKQIHTCLLLFAPTNKSSPFLVAEHIREYSLYNHLLSSCEHVSTMFVKSLCVNHASKLDL